MWLDIARGYAPILVAVDKQRADRADANKANANKRLDSQIVAFPNKAHVVGYQNVFAVTKWEQRGNVHVATGYTVTVRYELDNGRTRTDITRGTISEMNLSPNFTDKDFTIQRKIPDGTPVIVPNEPGIEHEWHDGQVMNIVDVNAMRAASEARMGRNRWLTRIAVGLVALVILGGFAFLFVRRRRAQP